MPKATVRATAQDLPKTNRDAAIIERVNKQTLAAAATAAVPEAAVAGSPTPSAEEPDLLDVSNELSFVRDLIEAAYMAADSLEIGRGPLTRLLDLTSDRLADAIDKLENIREARA